MNNENNKDNNQEPIHSEAEKQSNDFNEKNEQDNNSQHNLDHNTNDDFSDSDDDLDNLLDFPDFDEIDDFDDTENTYSEESELTSDKTETTSEDTSTEREKQEAVAEPVLTREEIEQKMKDLRAAKGKKEKKPIKENNASTKPPVNHEPEKIKEPHGNDSDITFQANENTPEPTFVEEPTQPIHSENIILHVETHRIRLPFNSLKRLSGGEKITVNGYQKGHVKLTHNNHVIATGQVMQIGDHLGIRIDDVNTTKI